MFRGMLLLVNGILSFVCSRSRVGVQGTMRVRGRLVRAVREVSGR